MKGPKHKHRRHGSSWYVRWLLEAALGKPWQPQTSTTSSRNQERRNAELLQAWSFTGQTRQVARVKLIELKEMMK